jgi:SAM-dependent MidA family methyltransferase
MDINPSTEEKSHSLILAQKIEKEIQSHQGQISFAKYMEMALYTPGFGYYASGTVKFGSRGDFVTAPEISPLFGATIVQTIVPVLTQLKDKAQPLHILEFGAGSGILAESILNALQESNIKINSYNILDLSADLIERQKERLKNRPEKINWIQKLPENFVGIILANEVLDAMPVEVIVKRQDSWHYKYVCSNSDANTPTPELIFCDGPAVEGSLLPQALLDNSFANGYTTEIHPSGIAWIGSLARCLQQGLLLTLDYGFPAHEYYHPQRDQGTVMAHYRHHAVQDPFFYPGLCDLTAHVEWTSITQAALHSGFALLGYTSQASYLLDAGIGDLALSLADPRDAEKFIPISNGLQKLLSEAEMGELFKALCLGKNIDFSEGELPGFRSRPRAL